MVGWRIALWVVLVATTLYFLYLVRGVLLPFVLAYIVCLILEPGVKKLRLRGMKRSGAVAVVLIGFFGVLGIVGAWVTPLMVEQVASLNTKSQEYVAQLAEQDRERNFFIRWNPAIQVKRTDTRSAADAFLVQYQEYLQRLGLPTTSRGFVDRFFEPNKEQIQAMTQRVFGGVLGAAGSVLQLVMVMFFVPIIVCFMLPGMDTYRDRFVAAVPPPIRTQVMNLLDDLGKVFVSYLRGVSIAIVIYMVLASTLLTILGAPYSILLGILFGILYLIPFIGAYFSYTILFLSTGFSGQTGNWFMNVGNPWWFGLILTACFFIYSSTFDQVGYPNLVGRSVGLPIVLSLFVVGCGFSLFGIVGALFAYPVAGALKVIIERILRITSRSHDDVDLPAIPLRHRVP